jgi:hypothetical protein
VPLNTKSKKGLLLVTLFGLLYFGMGLLEGFLPFQWRHAIDQRLGSALPQTVYAPHPDIDWEFELDFQQHPWHRRIEYAVLGILVLGDVYLISIVLRAFRKSA